MKKKKLFFVVLATVLLFCGCKKETCSDGTQNQNETGIDCGGPCTACPSCNDGIQNQSETSIDCGGPCSVCPTCSDGIQNQNETGVDCGGPCSACPPPVNQRIEFEKIFGSSSANEDGTFVIQTSDGGYLVTGDSLRKIDVNGTLVFTKPIEAYSIMPTSDGNYILGRQYYGNISKIDDNGNILWTQSSASTVRFIYQTNDGGFIGCGNNKVIKTDALGNNTWTKQIGTSGMNDSFDAMEVRQTNDSGYVVVGTQVSGYTWDSQFVVYKLSVSGTILWVKSFGSTSYSDEGNSIKATSDGGCIAAGMTGSGWFDMYLIKLDSNGNTIWSKSYGNSSFSESASHVQLTSDGGYVLVGTTDLDGEGNTYNVYVVKTNSSGVQSWAENFGGSYQDFGACIQQTNDAGFIITGWGNYISSNSHGDMYLLKLKY